MRSLILAGVACIAFSACESAPGPSAGTCDIRNQPAELSSLIRSLDNGSIRSLDSSSTDRAAALTKIAGIAVSAGTNAATDTNTANSLKCRQTSTLAYAALIDSDVHHADALAGLKLQASIAKPVCDQQASSRDAGIRASCDVVNTWSRMLVTLQAADTIVSLGQASRAAGTAVPDEIWPKVGQEITSARAEIRTWADLPVRPDVHDIKLGVGCQLYSALVAADVWRFSSSDLKFTNFTEVRGPTLNEIATAAKLASSSVLQTTCAARGAPG